jgi:hypothetical protein
MVDNTSVDDLITIYNKSMNLNQDFVLDNYLIKINEIITTILTKESSDTFTFDILDNDRSKENKLIILREKQRKMRIGEIWQSIIGNYDEFINLKQGHETGLDILSHTRKIAIELKNRTNTDNASSKKSNLNKLAEFKLKNPDYTCIYACINDKNEKKTLLGNNKKIIHNNVEIEHMIGMKFLNFIFNEDTDKILNTIRESINKVD